MKLHYKYLILFAWMIVIFLLSAEPAGVSSGRSGVIVDQINSIVQVDQNLLTYIVRKSAHFFAYFVLGLLSFWVIKSHNKFSLKRVAFYSVAVVAIYAALDEFHQLFVPGRSGEIVDVLLDTSAGIIAIIICVVVTRFMNGRSSK